MTKSEIYRTAIAAVIDNENLDMEIKIDVLQELFYQMETARLMVKAGRRDVDKIAEKLLAGMPQEPAMVQAL